MKYFQLLILKGYTKETKVATQDGSDISSTLVLKQVQYNRIIFPLMLEVMVKFPAPWRGSIFAHGGVGYELLWNKEQNFETGVSDNQLYGGFAWQGGAGLLFKLGSSSGIFAEGFYHNAKVKRNRKDIKEDLPVFEQVNLSGFGARIGISLGPI